ncbi:transketolase family protein [Actinophytocola algeriensis]|uniref:Transketolase n=1 Tax=Actinophytocola algeriensis TaxID=1768010 RepID=A0A7W7Q1I7_9PSEU|nr:transketolase C-terminal domain-containing protein [Actinophytocola algeriensis]MBB4905297.1 transketolase [Actinophytocola algeriensis]MBE1473018.1 transketolase [Actinophytocola algeriensis]
MTTALPESDRAAYRAALVDLARADTRIWCLDSDMGGLEKQFQAELPDQYVDVGIAEANLMSIAAALASTGILPFANTMAAFASARALEQVKLDIAYHGLPVRIVATHAGFSAAHYGPTHHAQSDLAAMRTLPNMTVLTPADAYETVRLVTAAAYLPGPVYLRLGRNPIEPVYAGDDAVGTDLTIGKAVELRAGDDVTIVAAGALPVRFALEAADDLAAGGVGARVLNLHTIKPLDVAALVAAAEQTAGIVTVEDHSVLGGVGGAVAEVLAEHRPVPVRRVGIADSFCARPGTHTEQLAAAGVSTAHVVAAALSISPLCTSIWD